MRFLTHAVLYSRDQDGNDLDIASLSASQLMIILKAPYADDLLYELQSEGWTMEDDAVTFECGVATGVVEELMWLPDGLDQSMPSTHWQSYIKVREWNFQEFLNE